MGTVTGQGSSCPETFDTRPHPDYAGGILKWLSITQFPGPLNEEPTSIGTMDKTATGLCGRLL
jgi:hypothetical protein